MSFFKKLEDPDNPLLGPSLKGLKLWRLWQPIRRTSPFLIYNFFHIFCFLFVLTQYIELWLIRDNLPLALRNLSVTMLSSICVVKAMSFIYWQNAWKELGGYVSDVEKRQISQKDRVTDAVIEEYTKYSRKITYFYWCLVTATVFTIILAPLFGYLSSTEYRFVIRNGSAPYPEILNAWLPFERTRGLGYWISVLEHSTICIYGGGVVATFDSNAVVIMTFFNGQLKLLSKNCEKLFRDSNDTVSYDEAVKRIMDCHNSHKDLVKFSSLLNSLLSPVMFLYVIICSLMICASAVQLTMEGTGNMQRIWIAEYLVALVAQLFLYCWHGNEVLDTSNQIEGSVYLSAWWSQGIRMRRNVMLLGGQLRKPIVFTAGPFTNLTVSTFVAILKGSYSYYTLLSKKVID